MCPVTLIQSVFPWLRWKIRIFSYALKNISAEIQVSVKFLVLPSVHFSVGLFMFLIFLFYKKYIVESCLFEVILPMFLYLLALLYGLPPRKIFHLDMVKFIKYIPWRHVLYKLYIRNILSTDISKINPIFVMKQIV